MRGKEVVFIDSYLVSRITPAYAGKRDYRMKPNRVSGDHPRVCGEKPQDYTGYKLAVGSPPRMRGKVFLYFAHKVFKGITPAYAGKRPYAWYGRRHSRDHPRVCGEKMCNVMQKDSKTGSPPRMRGKGRRQSLTDRATRITPAYAGKRAAAAAGQSMQRDHPRVCGEKTKKIP